MRSFSLMLGVALVWAAAGDRAAAMPGQGYALVVGSNLGGPGQGTLRYAEDDASRVAELLHTLGGYEEAQVERLVQPSAAELREALERIRGKIEPLAASGAQSKFFFYYSGHARADGLNLGAEQLPLTELRERIEALPATLSIVVLDGCQSGAFSRVKGANRAADFSWNSLERLNSAGIAVIASSSARELSQESDELRSGYFTHHWLVALRGGGDRDADGRVTLSEAYQYAYNHTLATTAQTAVGEQHATLETNIRGKDEVALTHPAQANTRLRIPAAFEGRVLLQRLPNWSVFAELDKAKSAPVVLALPAGNYAATLRRGSIAARCTLSLREGSETALEVGLCTKIPWLTGSAKGQLAADQRLASEREARRRANMDETWMFEVSVGIGLEHERTEYVETLKKFSFVHDSLDGWSGRFILNLQRRIHPHFAIGLSYFDLQSEDYRRGVETEQYFRWTAHAVGPYLQADVSLARRAVGLFARAGAGVSIAWTEFDAVVPLDAIPSDDPAFQETTVETHVVTQHYVRPCGFIGAGLHLSPSDSFGFQLETRYTFAPAVDNEVGDTQDAGGLSFLAGIHISIWE